MAKSPLCKTPRNESGSTWAMENCERTSLMRTLAISSEPLRTAKRWSIWAPLAEP
jgi:hypothetical protein